jgi:hypothetical protein
MTDCKICCYCRTVKPISDFGVNRKRPDGRQGRCKACTIDYRRLHHTAGGPLGHRMLLEADRQLDYGANQRRWAERAAGINYGGR